MKKSFVFIWIVGFGIVLAGCETESDNDMLTASPSPSVAAIEESPLDMSNIPAPPTPPPLTPENIAGFEDLPPEMQEEIRRSLEESPSEIETATEVSPVAVEGDDAELIEASPIEVVEPEEETPIDE